MGPMGSQSSPFPCTPLIWHNRKVSVDFFIPLALNYRPVGAANDVRYGVIYGVIAGLQKVHSHFSVMPLRRF